MSRTCMHSLLILDFRNMRRVLGNTEKVSRGRMKMMLGSVEINLKGLFSNA